MHVSADPEVMSRHSLEHPPPPAPLVGRRVAEYFHITATAPVIRKLDVKHPLLLALPHHSFPQQIGRHRHVREEW